MTEIKCGEIDCKHCKNVRLAKLEGYGPKVKFGICDRKTIILFVSEHCLTCQNVNLN